MRNIKNRPIAISIAILLTISLTASIILTPTANAHTPPYTYKTYARLHIAPNPVGVGQSVIVVGSINWALPGSLYWNDIRPKNVTFTFTKPDGHIETIHYDLAPDPGGSAFIEYTPDQVGTYYVRVDYGDTVYDWNTANEPSLTNNATTGDIFLGSSATNTLIVQNDPVGNQVTFPLPTEYWTRPIDGANTAWQTISSNWLSGASAGGASISTGVASGTRWQEDGSAPKSAHIMWTKPIELGGMVGGSSVPNAAFYSGMAYETRFNNPIIIGGILFYTQALNHNGGGGGYVAVDLRTGQELWRRDDITPNKGQLLEYDSGNQHGTTGGILWQTPFFGSAPWQAIDAFTGKNLFNLTDVPSGYEMYETEPRADIIGSTAIIGQANEVTVAGDITRYVMSYNRNTDSGTLSLWSVGHSVITGVNQALTLDGTEWRPTGNEINGTNGYVWTVPISGLAGTSSPQIAGVIPNDILLGFSSNVALTYLPRITQDDPWTMWAISLKPETRGQLLWKQNYAAPPGNITRMLTMAPLDKVNRVWIMTDFDTGTHHGYSIDTGNKLWDETTNIEEVNPLYRPMQGYSVREGVLAGGVFYVSGYGGEVFALSSLNGTLLWKFNDTDTTAYTSGQPWGLQPLHVGAIADGVVYAFAGEHSPGTPLYTGYKNFALNATTGEKLWDLFGWSSSGLGTSIAPVAIADGYLALYNCYDGQIYSIGKGPSALTVTAPDLAASFGQPVVIRGTVTDIAAGTQQDEQAARFPQGVPAVSDQSMSAWMEYVYQQKPRPTDVKGVDVTIDVIDSNSNFRNIGSATSDANGAFSYMWTPDIPGKYTVTATFAGSESYYPSHAETSFGVMEEPAPTATTLPVTSSVADQYLLPGIAIIVVAIAIVGALILVSLRKRP
jgi:hypothetical protein